MATRIGGRFMLRIEDIDLGRRRDAFVSAIFEDLAWLGLSWPEPVMLQSQRFGAYRAAVERLRDLGVLYPCAATRSEIQAASAVRSVGQDPDGVPLYPGQGAVMSEDETEQRITAGRPHALRLNMAKACQRAKQIVGEGSLLIHELDRDGTLTTRPAQPERWGDAIIVRKDVPASYHLAVVVDDAFQQVTHVTRGQDLKAATDIQRLLQVLLDLPAPIYYHHPLILDDTGKKLSKSNHATSLQSLRDNGHTPDDIRVMITSRLKLAQESF